MSIEGMDMTMAVPGSQHAGADFSLAGQHALVLGAASGGLGAPVARALGYLGATVLVADLAAQDAGLQHTHDELRAAGIDATAAHVDVTDEGSVDELVREAESQRGPIDILANFAGVMLRKPALEMSLEEWNRVLEVNLTGTWLANRAVARSMLDQGHGRIVNVSTLYTNIVGPIPESAYYASKAGVANLTRGLAAEWGPSGITVNCLAPGVFYPTKMTEPLRDAPERLAWMEQRTLLGRLGDPATEIGGVVAFLASPAARYITGQVIGVDGGWTAW